MPQNFQSSFIPKSTLGQSNPEKKKNSFFGFLMLLVFVATIVASVAVFFYKNSLKAEIEEMRVRLVEAGKSINQEEINEFVEFSDKLAVVRTILLKHQVVSGFMNSLASSTLKTVYFNDFQYNDLTSDSLEITLAGTADSYGAIALQQDIFSKNEHWKSIEVSNLKLDKDGSVQFDMDIVIDPKIVVYNPYIPNSATTTQDLSVSEEDMGDLDSLNLDDFNL